MTVAVQQPNGPQKKDPLDQIQQALGIAASLYGVSLDRDKTNALIEQNRLKNEQEKSDRDALAQSRDLDVSSKFGEVPEGTKGAIQLPNKPGLYLPYAEIGRREKLALDTKSAEAKAAAPGKPGEGVKTLDKEFAKEYGEWNKSGAAAFNKNMQRLQSAKSTLEAQQNDTIGPSGKFVGNLPDIFRSEASIKTRDDVRAAAQGAMKAALGPSFTEAEGKRIMDQAYNEKLSPKENIAKINLAIEELVNNKKSIDSRSDHFRRFKTLDGWEPEAQQEADAAVAGSAGSGFGEAGAAPAPAATVSPEDARKELIRRGIIKP